VTRAELEALLERARNPTLVPGIYNYCLHRCGRCPFTNRCFAYLENQRRPSRVPDGELIDEAQGQAQATVDLIRALCEREGMNPTQICGEPGAAVDTERLRAAASAAERDPIYIASTSYEAAAYAVVDPLRQLSPFHEWPPDVADALDTISWNAGAICAKLYRALGSRSEVTDDDRSDPLQTDWNGSAKVARLAIAESLAAWDVLFVAGETPSDAPIRQRRSELEQMDEAIARRFPHAMAFVRPGFDEPEVAAGALTSAAPLALRRVRAPQRVTLRDKLARWWRRSFRR